MNDSRLVFALSPPLVGPNLVALGPGLFAVNADGSGFRQLVETTGSFVKCAESLAEGLPWGTRRLRTLGGSNGNDVFVVRPEEVSQQKIDYFRLQRLNTGTGQLSKTPVASSRDFDLHPEFILRNDRLAGLRYTIDAEVTQWFDPR